MGLEKREDLPAEFYPQLNIFELIAKLIEVGLPVACSTEVGDLINMLNLPPEIANLINMAKSMVCGGMGLEKREDLPAEFYPQLNIFELIAKLIEVGLPVACSAEVGDLINMLNLPPEIANLINMAKSMVCGGMGI